MGLSVLGSGVNLTERVQDTPRNMRFSINFFTSIGLGGLTDSMREHLKNLPRLIATQQAQEASSDSESSSDSGNKTSCYDVLKPLFAGCLLLFGLKVGCGSSHVHDMCVKMFQKHLGYMCLLDLSSLLLMP